LLHLVGSSILLYLIDDARSNKNHVPAYKEMTDFALFKNQLRLCYRQSLYLLHKRTAVLTYFSCRTAA